MHDDHHSDEEVSVNYPELLEAVQERADLDEHGADSATIATLQALSERIGAKETRHLLAELPKQVRERILPPNRVEDPSLNAFVERVGRLENVSAGQARAHAGTVLGVLREAVSAGEARDVFARLSNEYADLLR